jgi:hypothetical protein
MDLISRSEVLKWIEIIGDSMNLSNKECTLYGRIYEAVENQPTAYDVDKVVEKLQRLEEDGLPMRSAINIVKGLV